MLKNLFSINFNRDLNVPVIPSIMIPVDESGRLNEKTHAILDKYIYNKLEEKGIIFGREARRTDICYLQHGDIELYYKGTVTPLAFLDSKCGFAFECYNRILINSFLGYNAESDEYKNATFKELITLFEKEDRECYVSNTGKFTDATRRVKQAYEHYKNNPFYYPYGRYEVFNHHFYDSIWIYIKLYNESEQLITSDNN